MNRVETTTRLNKFLASQGFCSRRKVDQFLRENKVEINGMVVSEPGLRFDPKSDKITINGTLVSSQPELIYFAVNKPKGIISTTSDEYGRKTVLSLVPSSTRLYPVGRLDQNTTGLIILTNDGELSNKLTHPRYETEKRYEVLVSSKVHEGQLEKLRSGVELKEGKTAPAKVEILKSQGNRTLLEISIHEGRNHEIRRMCAKVGLEIMELKRVAIGTLELGDLEIGKFRNLTEKEIKELRA